MPGKRTHLILPEELLAEIDALVGQRGRSAFLVDVLREEVRRRRLLQILDDPVTLRDSVGAEKLHKQRIAAKWTIRTGEVFRGRG